MFLFSVITLPVIVNCLTITIFKSHVMSLCFMGSYSLNYQISKRERIFWCVCCSYWSFLPAVVHTQTGSSFPSCFLAQLQLTVHDPFICVFFPCSLFFFFFILFLSSQFCCFWFFLSYNTVRLLPASGCLSSVIISCFFLYLFQNYWQGHREKHRWWKQKMRYKKRILLRSNGKCFVVSLALTELHFIS